VDHISRAIAIAGRIAGSKQFQIAWHSKTILRSFDKIPKPVHKTIEVIMGRGFP
jgi:hypothetical protein